MARRSTPQTKRDITADELNSAIKSVQGTQPAQIVSALAGTGVLNPLVIIGSQHLRVKRLVQYLRDSLFPAAGASASYFGTELTTTASIDRVVRALDNVSLFCPASLIVIYEADALKKAAAESLLEAIQRGGALCSFLVLVAANEKKSSLISDAAAAGCKLELQPLAGAPLRKWIEKEAQRVKCTIEPEAAGILMECYGEDLSRLSQEIAKLSLLTEKNISKALVQQISLRAPEHNSFQLIQSIAKRDVIGASALADDLVNQGMHPLQISGFLAKGIRILLARKSETGTPLHSELSNPWMWRNLAPASRLFSEQDLRSSLGTLSTLDWQLKSSGYAPQAALGLAVQALASRRFQESI